MLIELMEKAKSPPERNVAYGQGSWLSESLYVNLIAANKTLGSWFSAVHCRERQSCATTGEGITTPGICIVNIQAWNKLPEEVAGVCAQFPHFLFLVDIDPTGK